MTKKTLQKNRKVGGGISGPGRQREFCARTLKEFGQDVPVMESAYNPSIL